MCQKKLLNFIHYKHNTLRYENVNFKFLPRMTFLKKRLLALVQVLKVLYKNLFNKPYHQQINIVFSTVGVYVNPTLVLTQTFYLKTYLLDNLLGAVKYPTIMSVQITIFKVAVSCDAFIFKRYDHFLSFPRVPNIFKYSNPMNRHSFLICVSLYALSFYDLCMPCRPHHYRFRRRIQFIELIGAQLLSANCS